MLRGSGGALAGRACRLFRGRRCLNRAKARGPLLGAAVLAITSFLTMPATAAASPQRIVSEKPSQSRAVRVQMIAQTWAATATSQPPAELQKRAPAFLGHFPGYRAAKRAAARRMETLLKAAGRKAGGPSAAQLAAASAMVVFPGPGETDTTYIPPDSQIAAGPNYVVVAINQLMAIYDKTGKLMNGFQPLNVFFSGLNVTGQIFDPRLLYDQKDGRFVLSAADVDMTNFASGDVLLAVSATSDPTGAWYKYAINFMGRNAANTANTFPDFPGLGLSPTAIYLTSNQFELNAQCVGGTQSAGCSFSDAWIKVIALPPLLSGNSTLSITTFKQVQTADASPAFGIQPALSYGTPGAEFLVATDFSNDPSTMLNLFSITTSGTPALTTTDLTVPAMSIPPNAPQPSSNNDIITDDFRILNAVWSNGSLWCGQNVAGSSGPSVARWYQIALTDLTSPAVTQSGDVSGVGAAYYPELGVESDGTAAMTFTTSSPSVFASAAYTERLSSDPAGTMEGYASYVPGLGPYDEQVGNRWGDYSGLSLDPAGTSFWGIAEYAGTPDPNFGTEVAQISGPPSLTVSPASIAFNQVLIGQVSPAQQVTVTNISAASVTLGNASMIGPNAADFQLSADQCSGATLAAGASCTVSVASAPTLTTTETATLIFGAPAGEVLVGLSGIGYYAAILTPVPSPVNFPNTPEQTASAPIAVTITNTGNIAATGFSLSLYGPFAETNTCGPSLGVGATCQVQVTFYPTSVGSLTGTLSLNYGLYGTQISLAGTGTTAPAVTPCPASVNFGNQAENTTSAAQTVTLTNTGSSALTISGITTTGDFAATNNCPASLNPRTSCAVSVTFTPTTLTTETGSLQIADSATGSPQSVPLTGTGVTAAIAARAKAAEAADAAIAARKRKIVRAAGRIVRVLRPLNFQPNAGQFPRALRYVAWTPEYEVGVTRDGLLLGVPRAENREGKPAKAKNAAAETNWLRVRLEGANPDARAFAADELPGKVNYLIGCNPRDWRTNLPTYARLRIASVYPGVDLVYHGNQRRLEYDFVVRPGANPAKIRLAFGGVSNLRVTRAGDLVVDTAGGSVRFRKPRIYQPSAMAALGEPRVFRRGAWEVTGRRTAAFRLGRYDRKETLVIDPVLSFSTYLGGTGADAAYGIAVDGSGGVYVAGVTHSVDFPVTTGAFQTTCVTAQNPCTGPFSANDGFVSKLSSDGSTLLYSTYLGGSTQTEIHAIAVDSSGNAYVTGFTAAADFPVTTGAFETQCPSPANTTNGCMLPFVTKLNATGSALVYSTYLGGIPTGVSSLTPPGDTGTGIAVDSSGDAFVGGTTDSLNFPTTASAFQAANPMAGQIHGFLSELNPAGSALVFSTYLGGTATDQVNGIALDSSGNVYATGWTTSVNFPTTPGAFQTGFYGSPGLYITDAFIAKFSSAGNLVFSSLFAGSGGDMANAVAVDGSGAAYITGQINPSTTLDDFPVTPGAWETTTTYSTAFLAKLHPDGCALEYSTYAYFQQSNPPVLNGVTLGVDGSNDAYVGFSADGAASPMAFPNELQPDLGSQMFLMEMNPSGSAPLFTTPLGGGLLGHIVGMAVDAQGDIYVAGNTGANDFPVVNALQPLCAACQVPNHQGPSPTNAFIARISPATPSGISLTRTSLTFPPAPVSAASPATQLVGVMNNQSVALNIQSVAVSGSGYTLPVSSTPCTGSIAPGAGCIIAVQFNPTATGTQTGTVTLSDDAPGSPQQISLNGTGLADFSLTLNDSNPGPLVAGTDSASYTIYPNPASGVGLLPGSVAFSCTNISPATCTFNPSTVPLTGGSVTLTVTGLSQLTSDNFSFNVVGTYSGQTVTVPVQITFMDFSLGTSTNSVSVAAGQSATYQLSVTPVNNWNMPITFSCSGLPSEATCSFSPLTMTNFSQSSIPVTMTITTSAASLLPAGPGSGKPEGPSPIPWSVWLAAGILFLLLARLRGRRMLAPAALVLLMLLCVSCGGGGGSSSGGSPPPPSNPGTPSGTYSITVTGANPSLQRTVKVSLTVN
jgi:hypothetical protein